MIQFAPLLIMITFAPLLIMLCSAMKARAYERSMQNRRGRSTMISKSGKLYRIRQSSQSGYDNHLHMIFKPLEASRIFVSFQIGTDLSHILRVPIKPTVKKRAGAAHWKFRRSILKAPACSKRREILSERRVRL